MGALMNERLAIQSTADRLSRRVMDLGTHRSDGSGRRDDPYTVFDLAGTID